MDSLPPEMNKLSTGIEMHIPDGWAPLLTAAYELASGKPLTVERHLEIQTDMWEYFLQLAGVPLESKRAAVLENLVIDYAVATGKLFELQPNAFFWDLIADGEKKGGFDSMTKTGGVHEQGLDVSNCELTTEQLLVRSIKISTIAFLESQLLSKKLDKDDLKVTRNSILNITHEIKDKFELGQGWITHDTSIRFKDDGKLSAENYVWINDKWKEQVLVRIFSKDETKYADITYSQFENSEDIFGGDYDWKDINKFDDDDKWPLFAVSTMNHFPTEDSLIYKYRGSRGKNMIHVNIVETDNGRTVEFFAGHTRIDGLGVKAIVDAVSDSIKSKQSGDKRNNIPNFLIYPDLETGQGDSIDRLKLSDLVIFSRLSPVFKKVLSIYNKMYVDVHNNKIRELGLDPLIVNPRVNVAQLLSLAEGGSATFAVFPIKPEDRLSLALAATMPESILKQIHNMYAGETTEIVLPKNNQLDTVSFLKAIDLTRLGQSLSKLGLPVMGYIQGLVQSREDATIAVTNLVRQELDEILNPKRMVSVIGNGNADYFVSAQNHRRDGLSVSVGVVGDVISWRVNLTRDLFDKLDLNHPIDDKFLNNLFTNGNLSVSIEEINSVYSKWLHFKKRHNVSNSKVLDKFIDSLQPDELNQFRYCVIAKIYERMERSKSVAMELILRATEAKSKYGLV